LFFLLFRRKSDPEKKRRQELAAVAAKLKLAFHPDSDEKLINHFAFLRHFNCGDGRYAYNIFRSEDDGCRIYIFDHHFEIITAGNNGGVRTRHYYFSAWLVETPTNFPELLIKPETWKSRFSEAFSQPKIAFESAEFTRDFSVHATDRKFAYDVCHPQMMEYLLANRDLSVEVSRSAVALLSETWLRPPEVERNLSRLREVRKLLPNYIFKDNT